MVYSVNSGIANAIANTTLCWITVLLRCYVRAILVKSFWIDDLLAVIALILLTGATGVTLDGYYNRGIGQHTGTIKDPHVLEQALKDLYAGNLLYITGTALIKISFGVTLLRFLRRRSHVLFLKGFVVAIIAFFIFYILFHMFQCIPIQYAYQKVVDPYNLALAVGKNPAALGLKPRGHCNLEEIIRATYAQSAVILLIDLTLGIIMPILLLRDLKIKRSLKITSWLLLAMGALPSVATIARMPYISSLKSKDFFFDANPVFIWSGIEFAWCIITTSLATLKPVLVQVGLIKEPTKTSSGPSYTAGSSTKWDAGTRSSMRSKFHGNNWFDGDEEMELGTSYAGGHPVWAGGSATGVNNVIEAMGDDSKKSRSDSEDDLILENAKKQGTTAQSGIKRKVELERVYQQK